MQYEADFFVAPLAAARYEGVVTNETDAPLAPFAWEGGGKLTAARVRELAGAEKGTAVA